MTASGTRPSAPGLRRSAAPAGVSARVLARTGATGAPDAPASRHADRGGAASCRWLAALLLACGAIAASPTHAQGDRDAVAISLPDPMPAIPADGGSLRVGLETPDAPRAAIDPDSLAVEGTKAFRFTLVVTSQAGVRNVSHEAIRCDVPERRLLAIGRADGSWSIMRGGNWQPIRFDNSLQTAQADMFRQLCAGSSLAAGKPADLLRLLRSERYRITY